MKPTPTTTASNDQDDRESEPRSGQVLAVLAQPPVQLLATESAPQYPRQKFSLWQSAYGTAVWGLVAVGLVETARQWDAISHKAFTSIKLTLSFLLSMVAIYAFFSLMERVFPSAGPRKSLSGYLLNSKIIAFNVLINPLIFGVLTACVVAIGGHIGLGWIDLRFSQGKEVGAAILAFLLYNFLYEFFYYWLHRFQHKNLVMWQVHKLHHMDEQLCAVNRQSPLEEFVRTTVVVPLAVVFKLDPMQGMIAGSAYFAWAIFVHSNIRVPFGWASCLIGGPQLHRIHHSRLPEHRDKNFVAFFPIIDIIFGTYHHPKPGEYPPTGVHDERDVKSFTEALMLPMRAWREMFFGWIRKRKEN